MAKFDIADRAIRHSRCLHRLLPERTYRFRGRNRYALRYSSPQPQLSQSRIGVCPHTRWPRARNFGRARIIAWVFDRQPNKADEARPPSEARSFRLLIVVRANVRFPPLADVPAERLLSTQSRHSRQPLITTALRPSRPYGCSKANHESRHPSTPQASAVGRNLSGVRKTSASISVLPLSPQAGRAAVAVGRIECVFKPVAH